MWLSNFFLVKRTLKQKLQVKKTSGQRNQGKFYQHALLHHQAVLYYTLPPLPLHLLIIFIILLHLLLILLLLLHTCPWTLGQILPVIVFARKMVAKMAENKDVGRGPPIITSSKSLEMVGSGILILERLQLIPVYTHGQMGLLFKEVWKASRLSLLSCRNL